MCEVFSFAIFQVTLRTSSTVVIPARTLSMPTCRKRGSEAAHHLAKELRARLDLDELAHLVGYFENLENAGAAAIARSAALHAPFGDHDPRASGEQELVVGDEILLEHLRLPARAAGEPHQPLREHHAERVGDDPRLDAEVDQAHHRLDRVGGVQRGHHEVPGKRRLERDGCRFCVADLADQDDVGVLTEDWRVARRRR